VTDEPRTDDEARAADDARSGAVHSGEPRSGEAASGEADGPLPYATAARTLLRDTILRATDELVAERSWAKVTMAEVARAAGVSRQTVYNEFGNRSDLALAYASWTGDQLLDEVERCVAEHRDDLQEACVAAFAVFLDLGADHPLVRSINASGDGGDLAAVIARDGVSVFEGATVRLAEIVGRTWPGIPPDAVAAVSEVLVRLAVSHLIQPATSSEAAAAQVVAVLGPYLARLQTTATHRPG